MEIKRVDARQFTPHVEEWLEKTNVLQQAAIMIAATGADEATMAMMRACNAAAGAFQTALAHIQMGAPS